MDELGFLKVDAVSRLVNDFSDDTDTCLMPVRVDEQIQLHDQIVISAVDSIAARKAIWKAVLNGKVRWYLDARMAAEVFHLHAVDMASGYGWYQDILDSESDETVAEVACTEKATIYCGFIAAGVIGATVRKIITGVKVPKMFVYNIYNNFFFAPEG
jgi:hypothetical protein